MSFILDALKKSENERQRHQGPSLVDVPPRRMPAERPWWVIALGALLTLNLVVFVIVLLQKNASQPAAETPAIQAPSNAPAPPAAATAPPAPAPLPAQPRVSDNDPAVRSLADEAGVAPLEEEPIPIGPDLARAADVPPGPPIVRPVQGPRAAPVSTPPPAPAERGDEHLPTVNDITLSGNAQLPPMHLDIHVYAASPADRFVFLNMKKYREGDSTAEGLQVERIRRDGVVLNHQGTRFLLPRQ